MRHISYVLLALLLCLMISAAVYGDYLPEVTPVVDSERSDSETKSVKDEKPVKIPKLSEKDLEKVHDDDLTYYLAWIQKKSKNNSVFKHDLLLPFKVLIQTVPGAESRVSEAAYALEAEDATPLPRVNLVTLQANLGQIFNLLQNNQDIVAIESDKAFPLNTDAEQSDIIGGNIEELTALSHLRDSLGLTGKGAVIAVSDYGFNSLHPEITDRIKFQKCFASNFYESSYSLVNPCKNADSAFPTNTLFPVLFTHGTHVTAIAGGVSGIAPGAELILVNFASEFETSRNNNYCNERKDIFVENICHSITNQYSDTLKAFNYLLDLINQGERIDVLNLSFGSHGYYPELCNNPRSPDYLLLKQLRDAGVLIVIAAGNDSQDLFNSTPACFADFITVAALDDVETPVIANYSNFGKNVDIAAPGTNISAANYLYGFTPYEKPFTSKIGTSMAAPVVSGYIALLRELFPEKSADEIEAILLNSPVTASHISRNGKIYSIEEYFVNDYQDYIKPVVNFLNFEAVKEAPVITEITADAIEVKMPRSLFADDDAVCLTVLQGNQAAVSETRIEADAAGKSVHVGGLQPSNEYQIRVQTVGEKQRFWREEFTTAAADAAVSESAPQTEATPTQPTLSIYPL